MKNKLKNIIIRLFTHNVGLKVIAIIFAVMLWLLVVNVDNPSQSRSFTATVQVVNEDVLTAQGKYYTIANNENTVTFRVTARRSVMEQLNASDFTAVADMTNLENDSRIPVEITANRYSGSVTISGSTKYLTVEVGERKTAKFIIDGQASGTPADGYAVSNISVRPNVITISGPSEEVARIDSVVALCNIDGVNADISESVVPTLLDSMGDVVDTTDLTLSETTVNVAVSLLSVKDVSIVAETSGELAEGLELLELTTNPSTLRVMGKGSVLNELTAITLPGTILDLSTLTESVETTVDVTAYLPEGVSLVEEGAGQVTVTATIGAYVTQELALPTSNIKVENIEDGLSAVIAERTVSVTVTGLGEDMDALSASTLRATVDATGCAAGTHSLPLTIRLDDDYEVETAYVEVELSEEDSGAAEGTQAATTEGVAGNDE